MGLHVPGSAAGERRSRSDVAAAAAGGDPAQRSEVTQDRHCTQRTQRTRRSDVVQAWRSRSPLCPWCPLSRCVLVRPAMRRLRHARAPSSRRSSKHDGVHAGGKVRARAAGRAARRLHTQSDKPRDPSLIPTVLTIDAPAGVTVDEIVSAGDRLQAGRPDQPLACSSATSPIGVQFGARARRAAGRPGGSGAPAVSGVRRQALLSAVDGQPAMDAPRRAGRAPPRAHRAIRLRDDRVRQRREAGAAGRPGRAAVAQAAPSARTGAGDRRRPGQARSTTSPFSARPAAI